MFDFLCLYECKLKCQDLNQISLKATFDSLKWNRTVNFALKTSIAQESLLEEQLNGIILCQCGWEKVSFDTWNSYKFFVPVISITKHPNALCMKFCRWYSLMHHEHIWMHQVNMSLSSSLTLSCIRITQRTYWSADSWTPNQKDSDSVGLGWDPRICLSWKPLGDANVPIHVCRSQHRLFKFGDKI